MHTIIHQDNPPNLLSSNHTNNNEEQQTNTHTTTNNNQDPNFSLSQKIVSLLLWHDVLSSLMSLCSGVLFVFLIQFGGYSVLTLLSYLCLLQVTICFIFINGTKMFLAAQKQHIGNSSSTGGSSTASVDPNTTTEYTSSLDHHDADYPYVSQAIVLEYSGYVTDVINSSLNQCADLLRCKDNIKTIEVMLILVVCSIVGRLCDGVTMIGIMYIGLFTVPKIYLEQHQIIDERMMLIKHSIQRIRTRIKQILPGQGIIQSTEKDKTE